MVQPHSVSNREQVIDTMIELTRLSSQLRAIVAGSDSLELYLALRRRGFVRVSTTETCRIPKGQHAIGLITGQNSLAAIEAALTRISPFLCTSAAIAVLIDSRESGVCLKIRNQAGADGFSDRGRCQVPAGPCAFRVPTGLRSDGKRGVKSDDTPCKSRHLAGGLHPRSSHPVRRKRRDRFDCVREALRTPDRSWRLGDRGRRNRRRSLDADAGRARHASSAPPSRSRAAASASSPAQDPIQPARPSS